MVSLKNTWDSLTEYLNPDKEKWWFEINRKLTDEKRKYHNLKHLEVKFEIFEQIKHLVTNKQAMGFAIFFSYFEYDPMSLDSDKKNIEYFKHFCGECGVPLDSDVCINACDLLSCIGSHITDEHKTPGAYGSTDRHYFLDLDMAILGFDEESYIEYAKQVKGEYEFLPDSVYHALRLKVLQTFLQIPNIFSTQAFRDKFECQARTNIHREIATLL